MLMLAPTGAISDFADKITDWASKYASAWWFLAVIFVIAFLDSVVPIVPSETCVIIGGVAVATGDAKYPLLAVIGCGAFGAFLGDNAAYGIGHHWSHWFERRADRKPKFRARLRWADEQIKRRGGPLLITARFIPGGRTALTLSSGITRQRHGWFAAWVALATIIWATYSAGLAYLVGKPFKDDHTKAFWIAFGTAITINVVIESVRHVRARRARQKWRKPAV